MQLEQDWDPLDDSLSEEPCDKSTGLTYPFNYNWHEYQEVPDNEPVDGTSQ